MRLRFLWTLLVAMSWSSAMHAGSAPDAFVKICIENRNNFDGAVAAWAEVFEKKKEPRFSENRGEHRFMASESLKGSPEEYVTIRFNAKTSTGRLIECSVVSKELVYSAERNIAADFLGLIELGGLTPKDEAAKKKWAASVDKNTSEIRGGRYDWTTRLAPGRIVEVNFYPNDGSLAIGLGASPDDIPTLNLTAFEDVANLSSSIVDLFIETCVQMWGDEAKIRETLKAKYEIELSNSKLFKMYSAAREVGQISNYMIQKEYGEDSFASCVVLGSFEDAIFHIRYLKSKLPLKLPTRDGLYSRAEIEEATASGTRIRKFWLLADHPNLVLSVESSVRAANKRPDTLVIGIGLRKD